jgi:hypothetical protein
MLRKFFVFGILMAILIILIPRISMGVSDQSKYDNEPPVVLIDPCDFDCIINIGLVDSVYPGHGADSIFVTISSDSSTAYIEMALKIPKGLTLDEFIEDGSVWEGTIKDTIKGDTLSVEFFGDSIAAGENQRLFTMLCSVDDTTYFSQLKQIKHTMLPEIMVHQNGGECYADTSHGGVPIHSGIYWFDMDTVLGYSYQARDTEGDIKDTMFIRVPVYFKANFPVDSFVTGINLPYPTFWPPEFDPNPLYTARLAGTYLHFRIYSCSTVYQPSDTFYYLGDLTFRGHDYKSSYDSSYAFSKIDTFTFEDAYPAYTKVYCDSSQVKRGYVDNWHDDGAISYPVYSCTTTFSDIVGQDSAITMAVKAKHSFYAQRYSYFVKFDTTKLIFDEVTTPSGKQTVDVDFQTRSGSYHTYKIATEPEYQDTFIAPGSDETIFNIEFGRTSSFLKCFGCSTVVDINTNYTSRIYDFFNPDEDEYKIQRTTSNLDYFKINTGSIFGPIIQASIDKENSCTEGEEPVPYHSLPIDSIAANEFDAVSIKAVCGSAADFDSISNGDFSINWADEVISENGDTMTVTGYMSTGEVDAEAILLNIWYTPLKEFCDGYPYPDFLRLDTLKFFFQERPTYFYANNSEGILGCCEKQGKRISETEISLPATYCLSQNYPNPFNATSTIEYAVPNESHVNVAIYDILGRKIATLVNEIKQPGIYQCIWDADKQASGIYFYKMQAGDFVATKKMMLIK